MVAEHLRTTVETPQLQFVDGVVDVPVATQRQDPTFERDDLSEAVLASLTACKSSCAHVTADHEVLAKAFAEESQVSPFTGVHTTADPRVFDVVKMMSRLAKKERSAVISA